MRTIACVVANELCIIKFICNVDVCGLWRPRFSDVSVEENREMPKKMVMIILIESWLVAGYCCVRQFVAVQF